MVAPQFAATAGAQETAPRSAVQPINPGISSKPKTSPKGTKFYVADGNNIGDKGSVSGYFFVDVTGRNAAMDKGDVPLEGKYVLAQWRDDTNPKKGNGRVSPVYGAVVRPDGSYVLQFPTWVDELGQSHTFDGGNGVLLRVWSEDFDTEKYSLGYSDFNGGWMKYNWFQRAKWGDLASVREANIALHERPQSWVTLPEDQWVESRTSKGVNGGNVSGWIFRENEIGTSTSNGVTTFRSRDVALPNEKIVGSYLRQDVGKLIDAWKQANKGYSYDKLVAAQKEIIQKWDADPAHKDKPAIAETVWTTSDTEGKYTLQFRGELADGTIAEKPEDVNFTAGILTHGPNAKVNLDYMYVFPMLTKSDGKAETSENGANMRVFGGSYFSNAVRETLLSTTGTNQAPINMLFAVNNGFPAFNVLDYDTFNKPASVGTEVTAKATSMKSQTPYRVEWYVDGVKAQKPKLAPDGSVIKDKDGNPKLEDAVESFTTDRYGNSPELKFTVPEETADNAIVRAVIFQELGDNDKQAPDGMDEFRVTRTTSVSGTPKTVNPTKDPQDSGLKVVNKDKDTKVTAKDEDGNEIPVIIKDDETVLASRRHLSTMSRLIVSTMSRLITWSR
ncbi:hypothetical protein ACX3T8_02085 [Corynebacterium pyruviciproducens]